MAFRLVGFDALGKITSVSPISFPDNKLSISDYSVINPNIFSFIDETLLPSGLLLERLTTGEDTSTPNFDGAVVRGVSPTTVATMYDPRAEVTLTMKNPFPYFTYGNRIVQDVTKTQVSYNTLAPLTQPSHSTTVYKFPPSSGQFTRDTSFTGGSIYVTNIVKRDLSSYNAPHNRLGQGNAGTTYSSYGIELFFYPTSLTNNFTLVQQGLTGASACWKLGYDSSGGQLQFAWQGHGTTAGYNYTQNIVNTAGISLNDWNHVAVSLIRSGTSGVTFDISGYHNKVKTFTLGVTSVSQLPSRQDAGIYIGNNHSGTEGFNGYIDSLRVFDTVSTGGVVSGFYPYNAGFTLTGVPTLSGFTYGAEVCFVMNFNNVNGSSDFFAESTDHIQGIVCKITDLTLGLTGLPTTSTLAEVGVREVVKYELDVTGATAFSDPTGFTTNYGPIVAPFQTAVTSGIVHGNDYAFSLYSVYDNAPDIDVFRKVYTTSTSYDFAVESSILIEGNASKGSSGSVYSSLLGTNPFYRLFAGGNCYGTSMDQTNLFIDPLDKTTLGYIFDNGYLVTQGISSSSYSFIDGLGFTRTITPTQISNLRLDILQFQNALQNISINAISEITTAPTKNAIKTGKIQKASGYIESTFGEPELPVGP